MEMFTTLNGEKAAHISCAPDYIITESGKVYSVRYKRYLSSVITRGGYVQVKVRIDGKAKHKSVHRLIAEAFIPNPDCKPFVDHINRVRDDNSIPNLRWATREENDKNKNLWGTCCKWCGRPN